MKTRIKKPVEDGFAKVPVVMQLEALECGAACLCMVLAYYNKWLPLEQVRKDCGVSRDGSKAKNVLLAARNYGLVAEGFSFEPEELRQDGQFPCIIHWNFNHFVVLNGFKGNYAIINDPAKGEEKIPMEEFDKAFTGICLMFEPSEDFVPEGKKKSMLLFVAERMKGIKLAAFFVFCVTVILSMMQIISPGFSRVFTDRLLTGRNPGWVPSFLIALSVFSLVQIIIMAIKEIYSLKINGKLAIVGNASFMWQILCLPMEFYSQRMAGDIQQRQNTNATIASTLVNQFAPLIINAFMMVFYLVVMIRYSVMMTVIGLGSIILNLLISNIISLKRVNITRVMLRDQGKLAGATTNGIELIETIKSSGAENGFFEKWSGFQASANTQQMKYNLLERRLGVLPSLVNMLTSNIILLSGVYLAMKGHFTIGMIMAFQSYLTGFTNPANTLITTGTSIQEMRSQMERIDDIMNYPVDPVVRNEEDEPSDYRKLSGVIELSHVYFGYSALEEPVIRDFSVSIKPGDTVAFVGTSGCGKSTLSRLISGLYQPWEGQITFDGKSITDIDRSVFTGSVAVVDQDITLYEDTIANNIKMWDDTIEDFEMILAARDACIHGDIMEREGGYDYVLKEGGKDFSGGQRQRLEIARVLAQDPTIVILDEATSALDAKTEYEVVKSIKERGITCIVIAHRLSTIRDSDEIIVLDHGVVVERGKHEELYARDGVYTKLVTSE